VAGAPGQAPIQILFMVRELNLGGIERDVAKMAIHMDRSRFQPHVASYQAQGMRFEELQRAGVPLLHLPLSSLLSKGAATAAFRLWCYVRKHNIQIVHAYDASAVFAVPLARGFRVPVVISSQLGSRDLLDRRTRRQLRWTDRMVDTLIVNCEAMRRHLTEDEHVPGERIQLCYNGVDTREFYPANTARPAAIADASFVIGAICVLRPEKAIDMLQEAFALVRNLHRGMKLLIVGSGPELARLQANSLRLGIEDASLFVPATHQVAAYLRALDIFVLCSHSEAFSNALLEAMACGCCAVGSSAGGTPELIGSDERGLLCRAGDPGDLAEKLTMLIQNPQLRKDLGARAAEFARTRLTIEIAVERTGEIYEDLLRRKGVRA
jgi:glycosyltransferase involved in cell wall biosynthesis